MRKRTDLTFRLVALRRGQVSLPLFVWGDPDKIENHRKRENKIQGVAQPRRSRCYEILRVGAAAREGVTDSDFTAGQSHASHQAAKPK